VFQTLVVLDDEPNQNKWDIYSFPFLEGALANDIQSFVWFFMLCIKMGQCPCADFAEERHKQRQIRLTEERSHQEFNGQ
jgi:hypothetical protein